LEVIMSVRIRVNPIACAGHGLCAELLPERITLDEWGYPIVSDEPVPRSLEGLARRAVSDCPALALMLEDARRPSQPRSQHTPIQQKLRRTA